MSISIARAARPMARFDYSDDGKHIIAKIMQQGDKFSETEKIAEEWLAHIEREAQQGRYDATWVAQFKLEFDAFLKGNELPREGTPIRTWGGISREQGTRLISMGITTIEDLAAQPDGGLGNLGLDGRYLRDLAKSTLESAGAGPAQAKALADAEAKIRQLEETVAQLVAAAPKRDTLSVKKAA